VNAVGRIRDESCVWLVARCTGAGRSRSGGCGRSRSGEVVPGLRCGESRPGQKCPSIHGPARSMTEYGPVTSSGPCSCRRRLRCRSGIRVPTSRRVHEGAHRDLVERHVRTSFHARGRTGAPDHPGGRMGPPKLFCPGSRGRCSPRPRILHLVWSCAARATRCQRQLATRKEASRRMTFYLLHAPPRRERTDYGQTGGDYVRPARRSRVFATLQCRSSGGPVRAPSGKEDHEETALRSSPCC